MQARVVGVVRDADPRAQRANPEIWDRVIKVAGDVCDYGLLKRVLAEYEVSACFHLAAQASVQSALADPAGTFDTNVRGTWSLLEACRTAGGLERVIVASSDKAYGQQAHLPYEEERSPLQGSFPYDASKAAADVITRSYATTFGLPVAVIRAANIYGGGDLDLRRIVPGTIASALSGRAPLIRSDGSLERDYVFVDEVVAGYVAAAEKLDDVEIRGQAFNLGSETPVRVIDLVRLILKVMEVELEPEILGVAKSEIDRQFLSSEKARRMLGWEPQVPLEEGLRRTVEWYRAHRDLIWRWRGA